MALHAVHRKEEASREGAPSSGPDLPPVLKAGDAAHSVFLRTNCLQLTGLTWDPNEAAMLLP